MIHYQHWKKLLPIFASFTFIPLAMGGSVNVSLDQHANAGSGINTVNVTTEGTLDWGVFLNDGGTSITTPTESMNGGSGFVSLSAIGGASNTTATFGSPENDYEWTNGTPTVVGSSGSHDRLVLGADGAGTRLTINVATAGDYRLKFYCATASVGLTGTATLANGGSSISDSFASTNPSVLTEFYWTVDFTTDGADTLTLDIIRSGGVANVYSIEAFSLAPATTGPVSNLVIDAGVSQSTDLQPTPISIPFSNAGTVDLVISGVTPSGADAADFTVQSFTTPVAAGGNGTLEILFTPGDGPRTYSASLNIACNDPDSPLSTTLSVTATGVNQLGNLLLVGDSITEGRNGVSPSENGYSWRYFFWKRCADYAVGHQFVGTRTSNKDGTVTYPGYLGQTFTNRHEAIWGTTANEREANLDAGLNTMAGSASTPDTVVMFVGGNGVSAGTTVDAAQIADIASDISSMINMVQGEVSGVTGNPNVTVYLVSILPRFPGTTPDGRNANGFTALNNAMAAMPAAQSTATSKVRYLDLFSAMNHSSYYYDGTHPGAAGADRLAELIFSGMIADRDTDQLADGWEKVYFTDVDATDGSVDSDGDLIPDNAEYAAGSSPVDASSRPPQLTLDATGQLRITIPATDPVQFGDLVRHYTIRSSADLIDWSNIVRSGDANGSEIMVPTTFDQPAEFYRVGMTVE